MCDSKIHIKFTSLAIFKCAAQWCYILAHYWATIIIHLQNSFHLQNWNLILFIYLLSSALLGPHPQHKEVPRVGVQSELQLLGYATATATSDPSHVCDLHHSSWQRRILNPLSETGDWWCNLMVAGFVSAAPRWKLQNWNFIPFEQLLCLLPFS